MEIDRLAELQTAVMEDMGTGAVHELDGWAVVVNGRIVGAVRGAAVLGAEPLAAPIVDAIRAALAIPCDADTDVAALHAFLLANQGRRECARCGGKRVVTKRCGDCDHAHTHDCPDCDGDGYTVDIDHPVRVFGYPTSAWRLSLLTGWLVACGVGYARLGLDDRDQAMPLLALDAGDLRAVSTVYSPEARVKYTSAPAWPAVTP